MSGIWGGISILVSVALLFELGGCPVTGGAEEVPVAKGRALINGALALPSGILSMGLHLRAEKDGSTHLSSRMNLIEGLLFSAVGIWWWTTRGGFGGFHFPALILRGGFLLIGLGRFHRHRQPRK